MASVSTDELDEYEDIVDHDEAVVSGLEDERDLSDADELADVESPSVTPRRSTDALGVLRVRPATATTSTCASCGPPARSSTTPTTTIDADDADD